MLGEGDQSDEKILSYTPNWQREKPHHSITPLHGSTPLQVLAYALPTIGGTKRSALDAVFD